MMLNTIAILAVLTLIVLGIVFAFNGGNGTQQINQTNQKASAQQASSSSAPNSTSTLFASTQYAQVSYLIAPGALSQQAKAALAGFNMSSTQLSNGSLKVAISLIGTSSNQSVVLKPGYKLYIIETTFGDDNFNYDSSLGDDGFVMVDPKGYVVA